MKKKVDFSSFTQKAKSATKAVPLAVAISMLSGTTALAAVDTMKVDMGNGELWEINQNVLKDPFLRGKALNALNKAFQKQAPIFVGDKKAGAWIDFSFEAKPGSTIGDILDDPATTKLDDTDLAQYGTYDA